MEQLKLYVKHAILYVKNSMNDQELTHVWDESAFEVWAATFKTHEPFCLSFECFVEFGETLLPKATNRPCVFFVTNDSGERTMSQSWF